MEALDDHATEHEFEVEPENWETVQMWMRVQTQWRAGPASIIGLDYVAVDVVMRRLAVEDRDGEIFAGLQDMERAVLRAMARD